MRICFICNEYPPSVSGGIGVFTRTCGRALADAGHEVRVIGIYPAWDREEPFSLDGKVHVHRIHQRRRRFGWISTRRELFQRVAGWARGGEIDVVDVPDFGGSAAYWPALPVPVVAHLHGSACYFANEMDRRIPYLDYKFERASLKRADFCCSASRYTARRTSELFRVADSDVAVVFNPVAVEEAYRGGPRSGQDVVYTGTLTPKKGVIELIRAWPAVRAACRTATLHIYGKDGRLDDHGSMRSYLQAQLPAETRGSVLFHGHVDHATVISVLRSCRAAVFPSYSEAFGLAPMEAMAHGCPTIYTKRASGPELVSNGADGLLVDPTDIDDISSALIRLLTDDELARRLGEAGWKRVQQGFRTDHFVARMARFYEGCIEKHSGSRVREEPGKDKRVHGLRQ